MPIKIIIMLENFIKFSIKNNLRLLVILMNFVFGYFKNKKAVPLYWLYIFINNLRGK